MVLRDRFGLSKSTRAARSGHFAIGDPILTAVTLLLFVGACGKSAQLPLYVWLPDAMEGPTPVSALIHAATMVTAGVYMVARSNALFALAPTAMKSGGDRRRADGDLRGVDWPGAERHQARAGLLDGLAVGLHVPGARSRRICGRRLSCLHACVFQGAVVPWRRLGDSRHGWRAGHAQYGRVGAQIPTTYRTMLVATLAIAGIPPLAGFFSKDEILWQAYRSREGGAFRASVAHRHLSTAMMTAFYMVRLIFLTFFGESRMSHEVEHHVHESPKSMTVPLVVLAICSVFAGWLGCAAQLGRNKRFEKFLEPGIREGSADQSKQRPRR